MKQAQSIVFAFLLLCAVALAGTRSISTAQTTLSTSAASIAAANDNRRSMIITNHDAAINIFVGATGVTSSTGSLVKPGLSITLTTSAQVFAVAASGTPTVSVLQEIQ